MPLKLLCRIIIIQTLLLVSMPGAAWQSVELNSLDIRASQFADSYETLQVGDEEVVIVINESHTPITRGVAVLISESGRGAFNQHGLSQLSEFMNNIGWVSIAMPAPEVGFIPNVESQPVQASMETQTEAIPPVPKSGITPITTASFTLHEQQLKLQIQAVINRAEQYPGFILIISQGTTAAWLTKIYAEKQVPVPDAMIAVGPNWPQREYNMQLPVWVAQTEMPYLDIYTQWDSQWALMTVNERRIQATKELKLIYRQRELNGQKMDSQQYQFLAKEIYGWLTYMGW